MTKKEDSVETTKRRVSPRAPTIALEEAVNRVMKMYSAEGMHATTVEVALRHMGYSAKSGAALQTLASLGYWGLVERPRDGMVKVAKAVEEYQYNPDSDQKFSNLIRFLLTPPLFANLLEKYSERLPSDGTLQYELIQAGFTPNAASNCLNVFKKSIEFARYFERRVGAQGSSVPSDGFGAKADTGVNLESSVAQGQGNVAAPDAGGMSRPVESSVPSGEPDSSMDRMLIRLAGGRRAFIEIPTLFFRADRVRLKKYIDLLPTEDEDDEFDRNSANDE